MSLPRTGYAHFVFDGRDQVWSERLGEHAPVLLSDVPPVRDQGRVACCASMAVIAAMETLDARSGALTALSPLFHYYCSRRSPEHLGDVTLRQALATAVNTGISSLAEHDPSMTSEGAHIAPSPAAFSDAAARRVVAYDPNLGRTRYFSLDSGDRVEHWRAALSRGLPVLIGFHTTAGYWDGRGILEPPSERSLGGHAALVIGFADDSAAFRVLDSRGVGFADQGGWFLGYDTVRSRLVAESWVIEAINYDD